MQKWYRAERSSQKQVSARGWGRTGCKVVLAPLSSNRRILRHAMPGSRWAEPRLPPAATSKQCSLLWLIALPSLSSLIPSWIIFHVSYLLPCPCLRVCSGEPTKAMKFSHRFCFPARLELQEAGALLSCRPSPWAPDALCQQPQSFLQEPPFTEGYVPSTVLRSTLSPLIRFRFSATPALLPNETTEGFFLPDHLESKCRGRI